MAGTALLAIEVLIAFALWKTRRGIFESSDELKRLHGIDGIIARLSARVSTCASEDCDVEFKAVLEALRKAETADRSMRFVFEGESVAASHVVSVHGRDCDSEAIDPSLLPWITRELLRDSASAIVVERLSSLPADAKADRLYLEKRKVKSVAFFPCRPADNAQGVVALVHHRSIQKWSPSVSNRLLVLARVFANALESNQAQRALLDSEQMFRSLVTDAPIGIALEDLDGNIHYANPTLCSMFGLSMEELTSMNCSQFADPHKSHDQESKYFQAMRDGLSKGYQMEKCYSRKDESSMWGRVNVSLIQSTGGPQVVLATVEDVSEAKKAHDDLERAHEELSQLTARLIQVQEEEKRRIARELHDDIGQRLSLVMTGMDVLRSQVKVDEAMANRFRETLHELSEVVSDIHNMSHQLHSSKLQYLGLSAAMNDLCRQSSAKHHIAIDLKADQIPRTLPEPVTLCFYRVAQEALNNAIRHSNSPNIEVKLTNRGQILRMQINDFGDGFLPASRGGGLGLVAMQERLKIVGGKLAIESRPGKGCRITAEAPLQLT
jgi:PAS domain S-box-containing protein